MALTIIPSGNNPAQPWAISETFLPDQLIAGDLKIVTDSVTVASGATLNRGSVMGQILFGTATASTGKAYASGTIVVAALPSSGDTLTVNGTVLTFKIMPTGYLENPTDNTLWIVPWSATEGQPVAPSSTLYQQANQLCAFLNASTDTNISKMTYTVSNATITAKSIVIGTGGNGYTLATSNSSAFTVPANLSGGTANTGASSVGSISLGKYAKPGNYTIVASSTSSTASCTVTGPDGVSLPPATVGTAYANSEINFTITDSSTAAADTYVITSNPTNVGQWKLSVATATDGSEVPAGILADYVDSTSAAVTAGMYLQGEFNGPALIYDPTWTLASLKPALRPLSIYVKTSVSAADPA